MDIKQLKYLVSVVENEFNLSAASKKLHLTQPALSQYIKKFEEEESVDLFVRSNGRLIGLTSVGENFYANALLVLEHHNKMIKELREHGTSIKGTIRIGIPPLILTVMFTEILAQMITLNPEIKFEVLEVGAFDLRRMLMLHEVDFAIILQPTDLNSYLYKEVNLQSDRLDALMSIRHPLAGKKILQWSDLHRQRLSIFNETYMIHHQLMRKFSSLDLDPKITLMSSSWDFLLDSTRHSDFITILPAPIRDHFGYDDVVQIPIENPILWQVVITFANKEHYTRLERYTRDTIINYFLYKKHAQPINDME